VQPLCRIPSRFTFAGYRQLTICNLTVEECGIQEIQVRSPVHATREALLREQGALYLEAAETYRAASGENNTRAIATESFFWPPALSTLQRETNYRPFLRSSIRHLMRPEHSPDRWWEPRCRLPHFCSALSTSYHCCNTSTLLSGIRHWAYRFSAEHTLLQPRFPLISFLRKPEPVTAAELRDVAVIYRQPEPLRSRLPTTFVARRRIAIVSLVRATAGGCALSLLRVAALCRHPADHYLRLPGTFLSTTGNSCSEFPRASVHG
jgi:hypothetical protein